MSRKRSSQARGHPRSTGGSGSQGSPQTSVYPWEWPIYFGYVVSQLPSRKRHAADRRIARARAIARGYPPEQSWQIQYELLFSEGDGQRRARGRPPKNRSLLWDFWKLIELYKPPPEPEAYVAAFRRAIHTLAGALGKSPRAIRLRLDRAMLQFNVNVNAEFEKLGLQQFPRTRWQISPWPALLDVLAATPDSRAQLREMFRKLPHQKRRALARTAGPLLKELTRP